MTLPEVVTGELAGKFGEISLFDQHADFKLGSASNSNSTSPWAIVCEPATQPSHVDSPPRERFTRGPRNVSRAHTKAPTTRRAARSPYPSTTRTPTPPPATPRTPTPSPASTRIPRTSSTSGRTLRSPSPRTTLQLVRTGFRAGYNIYTRREIRLLASPQTCRPDRRELTLHHLPRLASLPGGNTTRSSGGVHPNRGGEL
jgi:hypothetical protein